MPQTPLGELTALSKALHLRGLLLMGREGKRKGSEGNGGEGKGDRGGEGRD